MRLSLTLVVLAPLTAGAAPLVTHPTYLVEPVVGTHYENGAGAPAVAWDSVNNEFVMYFESFFNGAAPECPKAGSVLWGLSRATSPDGVNWTVDGTPVLEAVPGTYYSCVVSHPSVVFDGVSWHMWFKAYQDDGACDISTPPWGCFEVVGVGYASSPDGISWTVSAEPAVVVSDDFGFPTVTKFDDTWNMLLSHESSLSRATAPAPEGPWTWDPTPVISPNPAISFMEDELNDSVLLCDEFAPDPYLVYFNGVERADVAPPAVGAKESSSFLYGYTNDPTNWTVPFTGPEPNPLMAWDHLAGDIFWRHWDVVQVGSGFWVFFTEKPAGGKNSVGLAYTTPDLTFTGADIADRICWEANLPPTTGSDAYNTNEETLLNVAAPGVLGNDSDREGDSFTAVLDTTTPNGALTLNADGSFDYTPNTDFDGQDSFTYVADDGTSTSPATAVTIDVAGVNDAPNATDDAFFIAEDTSLVVPAAGVLANDTDVDADPLTAVLITGPTNGNLTLDPDGGLSYTPDPDFNGQDSFTYQADDGTVGSNTATVTIDVSPTNDAPVALDDAYNGTEDTDLVVAAAGVLANDTDPETDPLTATLVGSPSNGVVVLNADGSFTYTPDPNFNGLDSFSYTASDGSLTSGIATVTVDIQAVNDNPVASDDVYATSEDTTINTPASGVLANDGDVDGDPITASLVTDVSNGVLSLNADGSFSYTPSADYSGQDSFTYQADDGTGVSNTATVTIDISPVNDAPVATDDAYNGTEDTDVVIGAPGLLGNDIDVDADSLTAVAVGAPANGSVVVNADGGFTYTPDPDFNGIDTFAYQADDGTTLSNVGTVTIDVQAVNDAPVAIDDAYQTAEDTPLNGGAPGVLSNDTDVESDPLTAVLVADVSNGSLTLNADGSFSYTPDPDFNGADSFTYQANDGAETSNTATVTIDVTPVDDAPVAVDDAYNGTEDTDLVVAAPGLLGNDVEVDGDPLTAALLTAPSSGSVVVNTDGSFTYTPDPDFNGADSFTYEANDGTGSSNPATVSITVQAVNDAPVALDDAYATNEDTQLVQVLPGVLGNDTDVESEPLTAVLVTDVSNGTLVLNTDGSFTYDPTADFNGADSFTYQADDGTGTSNVATVTIDVTPVNDSPVAVDDAYVGTEDTDLVVAAPGLLDNDSDVDADTLTALAVDPPSNGVVAVNPDGSFTYTPDPDFNGPDAFTYQATDGTGTSNVATVSIDITPTNDAPVAADDAYQVDEDTQLDEPLPGVLANDSDVDGDPLTATLVTDVTNGTLTLNADGSFTYDATADFNGQDSFTYTADDGSGPSAAATVTIDVLPTNDAPVTTDDNYVVDEDTPLDVVASGVLTNDIDPDGDALTAAVDTAPTNGMVTVQADGAFLYTPNQDFNGQDSFTYTASDGQVGVVGTVTIDVNPTADAPIAVDDFYETEEDTDLLLAAPGVLANDTDPDGDALTAVIVSYPSSGTITWYGDGGFLYVPDPLFNGIDSFTYVADDGSVTGNAATVEIDVGPLNDTPIAVDDAYATDYETALVVDATYGVLANDSDPDGDALLVVVLQAPAGTLNVDPLDGSFTYTPAAGFSGQDVFTYQVSDGSELSGEATVTIDVAEGPTTTGPTTTGPTTTGPTTTGPTTTGGTTGGATDTGGELKGGGCGCQTGTAPAGWLAWTPLLLLGWRRRRE